MTVSKALYKIFCFQQEDDLMVPLLQVSSRPVFHLHLLTFCIKYVRDVSNLKFRSVAVTPAYRAVLQHTNRLHCSVPVHMTVVMQYLLV